MAITGFAKKLHHDVWQGPKYISEIIAKFIELNLSF